MSTPCGYQQLTGIAASTGLTVPAPATANTTGTNQRPTRCIIKCEAQACRWRDDGVAPTGTVGYPLGAGEELRYDGNLNAIRFIDGAVAGAILNVSYYYG